jgi:hypothetical protein
VAPGTGGGLAGDAGGGGAIPDTFREDGGGRGGFFPMGGGGFGFDPMSGADFVDAIDEGRRLLCNAEIDGFGGLAPGTGGAGAPGGFGAAPRGGFGAPVLDVSGSDRYGELLSAPVFTPPDFRSFGMPPANSPASCGAADAMPPPVSPVSLLLRARFPGTGGASPEGGAGGFPMPGIGGAPPIGGPLGPSDTFPICGAERSLIWVTFFSRVPLLMSCRRAPCSVSA